MEPAQLPHEILLHISAFSSSQSRSGSTLMQQLMLHRPFYEYYTANRQYCIQMHTVVTTNAYRVKYTVFGKYHREDGPADIFANGTQYWFKNGKRHRTDGPASIFPDGSQWWYLNGKQHREDGPAIITTDGVQCWYQNDVRHREMGPAFIHPNGVQCWYYNGKYHREDGPAVITVDGSEWYHHGEKIDKR